MHIVRVPRPGERIVLPGPNVANTGGQRVASARTDHDWFWARHSPHAPASSARWREALDSVRQRPAPIVSRRLLRQIANRYSGQISTAARKNKVSEALILAVIAVESAGRVGARSHAGAEGLMQLIPATAARFGVTNSFDPVQNIQGGAAYLNWLLGTFNGDVVLALAGYNAGEGAVAKYRGVPPYSETRDYVVKVIDALAGAEQLCAVAPDGPRRACRWRPEGEDS